MRGRFLAQGQVSRGSLCAATWLLRRIFVDTSAFYALIDGDDQHDEVADQIFRRAEREKWRLITTNAVVFETHALLVNRFRSRREVAVAFLDSVLTDRYQVVRALRSDEGRAVAIVRAHRDKSYSLCDALSFVVMERLRVRDAISFDQDFRSFGRFAIL
ncbi:MAG TPA: PIN domain-containing protein [Candidatus Binataceae bacterium]|nr:PIN domain-containing protein [Candidatus Binataceae bacterium]